MCTSAHSPPWQLLITVVADEGPVRPRTGPRAAPSPSYLEVPPSRGPQTPIRPHTQTQQAESHSPTACLTPHPCQPCPALCWCPSLKGSCAEAGPVVLAAPHPPSPLTSALILAARRNGSWFQELLASPAYRASPLLAIGQQLAEQMQLEGSGQP